MGILARYYFQQGYRKHEIFPLMERFILQWNSEANLVRWYDSFDYWVKQASKFPLVEIDYIPITFNELTIVDSLKGDLLKKLLFTLLALAKYWNHVNPKNNNWINTENKDIFIRANIKQNKYVQASLVRQLKELSLISYSKKIDNLNLKINCIDNNVDADTAMQLIDYRNLGYQYMYYKNGGYFECECCGIIEKKKSNAQKYCRVCSVDVNCQKTLDNWREFAKS